MCPHALFLQARSYSILLQTHIITGSFHSTNKHYQTKQESNWEV